ncbi:MAG TPA: sigma-70 family RNA polymerase sigma factor [Isosphaeraceae bacterium]|jgi:RNA polymerase sigma factor (sigma-70 family)
MARGQDRAVLRQIRTLFSVGMVGGLTDGQLLERFTTRGGEAAEMAFVALVERHGPMVVRVCRSILRDEHAAQDAFQATFLVLARKAGTLLVRDSLGPWLHQVAYRVAACARSAVVRRRRHERRATAMVGRAVSEENRDDLGAVLHEELDRLPERWRVPLVLCYLEGLTHEQAARQLGWPLGTVQSRLARGREQLRGRLIRRGLATSVGMAGLVLTAGVATAAVPAGLLDSTTRAAMRAVAGEIAAGGVSTSVVSLTERMLRVMFLNRLKVAAAALVVPLTVGVLMIRAGVPDPSQEAPNPGLPAVDAASEPSPGASPPQRPGAEPDVSSRSDGPAKDREGEPLSPDLLRPRPWETAVRIKVYGPRSVGFGSGTIISSTPEESLVLTCAHTFQVEGERALRPPGQFPHRISVDLFDGKLGASSGMRMHPVGTVTGEVIDYDLDTNVGLVRIRPGRQLPTSRVVSAQWEPRPGLKMITVGCSEGNDATAWTTEVVNSRRLLKNRREYEAIECRHAPKQGRSGGGLFTLEGDLAGVCNFADPSNDVGLYAAPRSLYRLLDRNGVKAREGAVGRGEPEPPVEGPASAIPPAGGRLSPASPERTAPGPASEQDHRLREVERKLDQILKALGASTRD